MAGNLTAMIASIFSGGVTADPYYEYTTLLLPGNGTNGAQNNSFLDTGNPAEFTASITGTTMTVTAVASGTIKVGVRILGSGVSLNTTITAFVSGTSGGVGVYTVSTSQTVSTTTITSDGFPITRNGTPMTQGTFSPFSQTGWGNYFDGSGDYLTATNNAAYDFGTGNFTVETWAYITSYTGGATDVIISNYQDSTNGWTLGIFRATGKLYFAIAGDSGQIDDTAALPLNQWVHIAAVRSSTTMSLFVNGTRAATTTDSTNNTSTSVLTIGTSVGGGVLNFNGYLSNTRVVKGTAVYDPTQSTLPVPTAPLTAISGTSLLTCQSNRFKDNSTNNFTITKNGDTRVVAFSPFNPTASWSAATNGGSGYFDGSGDYLTGASTSGQLGAGDFTVEAWVYSVSRVTNYPCIFSNYSSFTTGSFSIFAGHASSNTAKYQVAINGTFPAIVSSSDIVYNAWTHVAVVRNGSGSNNVTLYLNGVANGTVTSTATLNGTSGTCWIGASGDSLSTTTLNGYISNLRIVKGTAVYTGNFTPPTAPLTAIINTSLLLNFTNAGIYDATSKNDLETVGNAQISTAISAKWGSGSMYFDGTGDYLVAPTTNLPMTFGTGDFTIEGWIYPASVSGAIAIVSNRFDAGADTVLIFAFGTTYGLFFHTNATSVINSGTNLTVNTWQHIALSRASGTARIFLNGTQVGSSASSAQNLSSTAAMFVGQDGVKTSGAAAQLNGYLQDLRITKGYARYTANFTPPTAAFPTL